MKREMFRKRKFDCRGGEDKIPFMLQHGTNRSEIIQIIMRN
jgi:hypothetical protein